MFDVIKIRLYGGLRGEVGKATLKKEMDFYDVTHDTLFFLIIYFAYLTTEHLLYN